MGSRTSTAELTAPMWAQWTTHLGAPWVLNALVPLAVGAAQGSWLWGGVVAVIAGVIPIAMILVMMLRRRVADVHVTDRSERTAVIGGIIAVVAVGLVVEAVGGAPAWALAITVAGLVTIVAVGVVTSVGQYQISVHTAVAAAWVVLAAGLVSPWALLTAPLVGVLGASRVALGDHTRGQTLFGAGLGVVVAVAALPFA